MWSGADSINIAPISEEKGRCLKQSVMASEPTSLNDLPEEILLKILSHFGPEDLCLIIAKVCERWNVLAKDKVLCKKLSYSCDVHSSPITFSPYVILLDLRCVVSSSLFWGICNIRLDVRCVVSSSLFRGICNILLDLRCVVSSSLFRGICNIRLDLRCVVSWSLNVQISCM